MSKFIKDRIQSFKYAFEGWYYLINTQKNAWIHLTITILVIITSFMLHLSLTNWAILVLTISSVWAAEMVNTAIEATIDLTSPETHHLAKAAKDVAAGAVLITAIASIVIGLLVLGPPLLASINALLKL